MAESKTNAELAPPEASRPALVLALAIALACALAAYAGGALTPADSRFSAIQLGAGVAFCALLQYGLRYWPAAWLGQCAGFLLSQSALASALASGTIDTLCVLLGVALLQRRLFGELPLLSMRHLGCYLVFGVSTSAGLAMMLTGFWWMFGLDTVPTLAEVLAYLLGYGLGILLVAPLVFAVLSLRREAKLPSLGAYGPPAILTLGLVLLYGGAFEDNWSHFLGHLWPPALIWLAWRGEQLGSALAVLMLGLLVALMAQAGSPVFLMGAPLDSVLHWQVFMLSFAVTALVLGTAARERRRAETALRDQQSHLEVLISARTGALERALREREQVELDLRAEAAAREVANTRLNESQRRYEQLIETLNDGFVLLDADGLIDFGNRRLSELAVQPPEALNGRHFAALFGHADRRLLRRGLARAKHEPVQAFELALRQPGGKVLPVLVSPAPVAHDGRFLGWSLLLFDLRARKAEELARQELLRVHRDALVREVHHRIKNNLQGIVGLLRQHRHRHPEHADALETAIAQVNSVATVYGLQAREKGQILKLRDLVESVRVATAGLTGARITLEHDAPTALTDASLSAVESVPIALVLNELLTNAVKHCAPAASGKLVSMAVHWHDAHVVVTIRNPALPGSYPPPPGSGGTGLSLVRALLPSQGASLVLDAEPDGFVTATLRMQAPVLFIEHMNAPG